QPAPHHAPTTRTSTSRHLLTSSVRTYSSGLWSPAPPGPKSTVLTPRAPRSAASVQKLRPTGCDADPAATHASSTDRGHGCEASIAYGGGASTPRTAAAGSPPQGPTRLH